MNNIVIKKITKFTFPAEIINKIISYFTKCYYCKRKIIFDNNIFCKKCLNLWETNLYQIHLKKYKDL